MPRIPATRISRRRASALRERLDALIADLPVNPLDADPVAFVHRYSNPCDVEVAGVFAANLAFGRVASFWPALEDLFAAADAVGGPARWVDNWQDDAWNDHWQYRWVRATDIALMARTLGEARRRHGSLRALFVAGDVPQHKNLGPVLEHGIGTLRALAVELSTHAEVFEDLPRGFRHLLPCPSKGSACKRWNLFLRWMVRRPTHAHDPDLGLWDLPQSRLVIPVDTHVLRIAQFVGLTRRTDGSWRTAQEITANLCRVDHDDPVRFDFALAHLGISGACHGRRVAEVCDSCILMPMCRIGRPRRSSPRVISSLGGEP